MGDRDIPFGPDMVMTDPASGKRLDAYVGTESDAPQTKRYRYECGVVLRRLGAPDRLDAYACSLVRHPDDGPPLLWEDDDLRSRLTNATEVHVPADEFRERFAEFGWLMVWTTVQTDELVSWAGALGSALGSFPKDDFPGYEVMGGVIAERVYEA
jgi:hypothetical protein